MENYKDKLATGFMIFIFLIVAAGYFLGKITAPFIPKENQPTTDYDEEGEI